MVERKKTQSDPNQNVFTQVDIRVGKIVKVWEHEGSDKLFCEEIDVGEDKPRQIASGLRAYYNWMICRVEKYWWFAI